MTTDFDYSVRVKNGSAWRNLSRVRLMISVGKEYHEGKKLAAVVDWINRNPNITSVHISVNDLLQRHNYIAAGMSPEEAEKVALSEGALWMARNDGILADIKADKFYTRWSEWLHRPQFAAVHRELLAYARANAQFDNALADDAASLAERKSKRGEPISATLRDHSRNYIEEEMTIFAMQSAECPAAEVYPGSNLKAAEYLANLEASERESLPELIRPLATRHFTRIDFSRINVTAVAQAG